MHVISAYMFQYYPLFVMRMFGHLPGLPGFILSAVFSGSLRSEFYSSYKSLITINQQCIYKKSTPYLISWYKNTMKKCINCRQNWRITVVSPALYALLSQTYHIQRLHIAALWVLCWVLERRSSWRTEWDSAGESQNLQTNRLLS